MAEVPSLEQLAETRVQLQVCRSSLAATLEAESCSSCGAMASPAILREASALARATAALSAEERQRDKHEREIDDKLTEPEVFELVKDYIGELSPERRENLAECLAEMRGEGGLLAG